MDNRVIVFTSNNARILVNPENLDSYRVLDNCLVNPDLSAVKGLPPHYWKLKNGTVVPKTPDEIKTTLQDHVKQGVDNSVQEAIAPAKKRFPVIPVVLIILILISIGIYFVCRH